MTNDVKQFRARVRTCLDEFVRTQRNELQAIGQDVVPLIDAAADFVAGGKLLRPQFCFAGWISAGGDGDDPRIVHASSAFEWLQASALAHDDLMDDSDTRRGKPSLHRQFAASHGGDQEAARAFGGSVAILLGDLMLSWSDSVLRSAFTNPTDTGRLHAALDYFDRARTEVIAGQFLDVSAQTRTDVSVAEASRVLDFKSAKYTVERPLHVGAVLAGADPALVSRLSAYACPLGEAFQLRDDVLGVFGDPQVTGKPAGDDLREGKRTVLVARALELADSSGQRVIRERLGDGNYVDQVRQVIEESGARSAVERDIDLRLDAARDAIAQLPSAAKGILGELLERTVHREY